jgi:hypothetical protein
MLVMEICIGYHGALVAWRDVPSSRVPFVNRLAIGLGIATATRGVDRRTLDDPLVQAVLTLLSRTQFASVQRHVANAKLVVALVVGINANAEFDHLSSLVGASDVRRNHVCRS